MESHGVERGERDRFATPQTLGQMGYGESESALPIWLMTQLYKRTLFTVAVSGKGAFAWIKGIGQGVSNEKRTIGGFVIGCGPMIRPSWDALPTSVEDIRCDHVYLHWSDVPTAPEKWLSVVRETTDLALVTKQIWQGLLLASSLLNQNASLDEFVNILKLDNVYR